jgi:hypothetical protein
MKIKSIIPALLALVLLTGCLGTLVPKSVELFQKKTQVFPEQSPALKELEREAIYQSHEKATETVVAALKENTTTNVLAPATDTMKLTQAAMVVAGPPEKIPTVTADVLANKATTAMGAYDYKVEKFAKAEDEVAGKKIEGTGLIQVPYFLWIGGIFLVLLVLYEAAKTLLKGAAVTNPGAAVGLGVVNVAQSTLAAGFSQVIKGGEDFKDWVTKEFSGDQSLQSKILTAFQTNQMKAQDQTTQNTVAAITK